MDGPPRKAVAPGLIKMPALGRCFNLGAPYNYLDDSILATQVKKVDHSASDDEGHSATNERISFSTTWDPDWDYWPLPYCGQTICNKRPHPKEIQLQVKRLSFNDGPSSKWSHMKLDRHLQTSILAGIISKLRGASKYMKEEPDTTQAVEALHIRLVVRNDVLDELPEELPDKATHVVTGVEYGAEAYIVFQQYISDEDIREQVQREMDITVKSFIRSLMDGNHEDLPSNIHARFFGDLHDQYPPDCNLPEGFRLTKNMMESLENDPGRAIPITVWLKQLDRTAVIQELDVDTFDTLRRIFDDISRIKAFAQTLLNDDEGFRLFPFLLHSLHEFIHLLSTYVQRVRSELHKVVPTIRSGEMDQSCIKMILNSIIKGHFNPAKLEKWLDNKRKEMQAWKNFASPSVQERVPLILTQKKLDSILYDVNTRWTVTLILPSTDGRCDSQLISMKHQINTNQRIGDSSHDESSTSDVVIAEDWFSKEDGLQDLFMASLRMFQQAERGEKQISFVMTSVLDGPSPYQPTLALFDHGRKVNGSFHLPVPPTNVRIKDTLRGGAFINLEWDYQQLEDVLHFLIQYRKKEDVFWSSKTTSSAVTFFLFPFDCQVSYGHQIRIAAVSLIGPGEFSEVFYKDENLIPTSTLFHQPEIRYQCPEVSLMIDSLQRDLIELKERFENKETQQLETMNRLNETNKLTESLQNLLQDAECKIQILEKKFNSQYIGSEDHSLQRFQELTNKLEERFKMDHSNFVKNLDGQVSCLQSSMSANSEVMEKRLKDVEKLCQNLQSHSSKLEKNFQDMNEEFEIVQLSIPPSTEIERLQTQIIQFKTDNHEKVQNIVKLQQAHSEEFKKMEKLISDFGFDINQKVEVKLAQLDKSITGEIQRIETHLNETFELSKLKVKRYIEKYTARMLRTGPNDVVQIGSRLTDVLKICRNLQTKTDQLEMEMRNSKQSPKTFPASGNVVVPVFGASGAAGVRAGSYVTYRHLEIVSNRGEPVIYGCFNERTGLFTAGTCGIYFLMFNSTSTGGYSNTVVQLRVNTTDVASSFSRNTAYDQETLSISTLVKLNAGDQVGVYVDKGSLCDTYASIARFAGILLVY